MNRGQQQERDRFMEKMAAEGRLDAMGGGDVVARLHASTASGDDWAAAFAVEHPELDVAELRRWFGMAIEAGRRAGRRGARRTLGDQREENETGRDVDPTYIEPVAGEPTRGAVTDHPGYRKAVKTGQITPILWRFNVGAGTDAESGMPELRLMALGELGFDAPDQRYLLGQEVAVQLGVALLAAGDPAGIQRLVLGGDPKRGEQDRALLYELVRVRADLARTEAALVDERANLARTNRRLAEEGR